MIVFCASFIVLTFSICLPTLLLKATNWRERGYKLFSFGFMITAVPTAVIMIIGKGNLADFFVSIGLGICLIAITIILLNWKSFT